MPEYDLVGRSGSAGIVDGALSHFGTTRRYTVAAADEGTAVAAAITKLNTENGSLVIDGLNITGIDYEERTGLSPGWWDVTFHFGSPEVAELRQSQAQSQSATPRENGREYRASLKFSAVPITLKQSLATTKYGTNAPDNGTFIGVRNYDGKVTVEGHPEYDQSATFTIPCVVAAGSFTDAQLIAAFRNALLHTNATTFKGFDAKSVRLMEATASPVPSASEIELNYTFTQVENRTGITIGGISSISKDGHEILEVLEEPQEDATANAMKAAVKGVYVHRVADNYEFNNLPGLKAAP